MQHDQLGRKLYQNGRNLRSILLLTDKSCVQLLCPTDMDTVRYYSEPDLWRVLSVMEILKIHVSKKEESGL